MDKQYVLDREAGSSVLSLGKVRDGTMPKKKPVELTFPRITLLDMTYRAGQEDVDDRFYWLRLIEARYYNGDARE
jgi:hypothetical protein